jgi:hypothetical protein
MSVCYAVVSPLLPYSFLCPTLCAQGSVTADFLRRLSASSGVALGLHSSQIRDWYVSSPLPVQVIHVNIDTWNR